MRSCLILSWIVLIAVENDIQADQSRENIGVTRAKMMALFQKPSLGFVFGSETRLKDGRLRIRATCDACPEYYLTAELIGPRQGHIQQAAINFALDSSTSENCRSKGALALNSLLATIFPAWEKDIPDLEYWLYHSMAADEHTTVYRNGLRVNLVIQKPGSGRMYTLVVDAEE